jgi:hypothetical protein
MAPCGLALWARYMMPIESISTPCLDLCRTSRTSLSPALGARWTREQKQAILAEAKNPATIVILPETYHRTKNTLLLLERDPTTSKLLSLIVKSVLNFSISIRPADVEQISSTHLFPHSMYAFNFLFW